ncbi:hypothetical protein Tco_0210292 [Tanacetum coccineum]
MLAFMLSLSDLIFFGDFKVSAQLQLVTLPPVDGDRGGSSVGTAEGSAEARCSFYSSSSSSFSTSSSSLSSSDDLLS